MVKQKRRIVRRKAAPRATASPTRVVGVGASAGGLDACKALLSALPSQTQMAFVLVLHLDPRRESHMAELLQVASAQTVLQAKDKQALQPDHIYVIAPDTSLTIRAGRLYLKRLTESEERYSPIDTFFSSLAQDQKALAVGIILSGTGQDGSTGMKAIKAAGGLCLVQDPATAEYDGMPQSAVNAGAADHVLPTNEMPRILLEQAQRPSVPPLTKKTAKPTAKPQSSGEPFTEILNLLGAAHGVDFSHYKRGTLERRTERRMQLKQMTSGSEYLELLQVQPKELRALYHDMLIGVTYFFREPEAFAYLGRYVAPKLIEQHDAQTALRIWVPGCATGEEAYSLAMLFHEQIERAGKSLTLQLYATDVDENSLATARMGIYPVSSLTNVSLGRRARFFTKDGERVQVTRQLRDTVTFAVHNLTSDPPFSRLDLVSCRNVLIYLLPRVQEKVIEMLHFALHPQRLLLLGHAESIGRQSDLFETVSKKWHIYRSVRVTRPDRYHIPQWIADRAPPRVLPHGAEDPGKSGTTARLVEQVVLSRYTTACVVITRSFEILYLFGPTHDYLTHPVGEAHRDLLSWARPGLYPRLRVALQKALETKAPLTVTNMRTDRNGQGQRIECTIEPIAEDLFLVAFRDLPTTGAKARATSKAEPPLVRQLDDELKRTQVELRTTVALLNSTNEEYRTSHEELLSLNEELQSRQEELETSKEELQSLHEETITINRQLEETNAELRFTNVNLQNLLASTDVPSLFLNRVFQVRFFTPAATKLMRIVASDIGRKIDHIKARFTDAALLADCAAALNGAAVAVVEIQDEDQQWYLRRVLPFRTDDNRVDGVCIVWSDITAQKQATLAMEEAKLYAETIVQTISTPLLVLDEALQVISANPAFYQTFKISEGEIHGRQIYDLGGGQWNIPRLRALLEDILPKQQQVNSYDVETEFKEIGWRLMRVNARAMSRPQRPPLILVVIDDLTDWKLAVSAAEEHVRALDLDHRRKDEFLAMLGHELRNPLAAIVNGLSLLALPRIKADAPRAEEVRAMMERQAGRIRGMLDQLLDITRIVSGKIVLSQLPVDLGEVVKEAIEAIAPLIDTGQHELICALPSAPSLFVCGDKIRLTQVLENILANAAKFSEAGSKIWLTVSANQQTVWIKVRDNGIGIDATLLPHVFEPFTQAPRALDRAAGGLGLGLALVLRLVQKHGGTVEAHSAGLGQGSEFVVSLPRMRERRRAQRSPDLPVTQEEPRLAVEAPSRRILIVDDEALSAAILGTLLTEQGHQTLSVNDGPAALAAAASFEPHVVLLDLGLPGLDGYQVATRLRQMPGGAAMLLVALTGYARDEARAQQAGFDHHLLKPPDLKELAVLIASTRDAPA